MLNSSGMMTSMVLIIVQNVISGWKINVKIPFVFFVFKDQKNHHQYFIVKVCIWIGVLCKRGVHGCSEPLSVINADKQLKRNYVCSPIREVAPKR